MILLLQNFANLKISSCSLDLVCKISEFWSISWYFWSFKTFFIVSFLAFFSCFFTVEGLHIAVPLVNTKLKDTGYSFYRSGVCLENYTPWQSFQLNPVFLSLNCIKRSEAAISLKNKLKNHLQSYSCWLDDHVYHF